MGKDTNTRSRDGIISHQNKNLLDLSISTLSNLRNVYKLPDPQSKFALSEIYWRPHHWRTLFTNFKRAKCLLFSSHEMHF